MEHPASKRLPGKRVVAVLLGLIALVFATAVALFFLNREPSGPILAMRAAPGGRALVLRRGFEARDTVHVVLYDARGEHVWSEALFGAQPGAAPLVAGSLVVVPALDPGMRPATHVFRLEDGAFVFRAEPPPEAVPSTARAYYAVVEGRLVELYPGDPGAITAYELELGRRIGRVEAPAGAEALSVVSGVVVVAADEPVAIDPSTLEPTAMPAGEAPALTPARSLELRDGCVAWRAGDGRAAIALDALGEGAAAVVAGEDAVVLRVGAGPEVVLAAVDDQGALRVARARSSEGPIAATEPEHVGAGTVLLRTERDLVALRLPSLDAPEGGSEAFAIESGARAATGCGDVPPR